MKNENNRIRRERMIMLSSSVFVLAALTFTGVYMRNQTKNSEDKGYTIDFSELEKHPEKKAEEIGRHKAPEKIQPSKEFTGDQRSSVFDREKLFPETEEKKPAGGSRKTSVDESRSKGMSDGADTAKAEILPRDTVKEKIPPLEMADAGALTVQEEGNEEYGLADAGDAAEDAGYVVEAAGDSPVPTEDLHFEASAMVRPVEAEVLIPYSMGKSVYFKTLDQYRYNPAVIYSAAEGTEVKACCGGRVIDVHSDAQLGSMMVLELGDGYQAVYGQLADIEVPVGGTVEPGMKLAEVAAPTKYYSLEGANLYFQMTKDGNIIDPEQYFR
ncbi:MAG: M23 family metallopeptidase [Lachnospiraceae bacterium]|nr:M23 family metallopeptidase [Lachnospiraceae bacterium]